MRKTPSVPSSSKDCPPAQSVPLAQSPRIWRVLAEQSSSVSYTLYCPISVGGPPYFYNTDLKKAVLGGIMNRSTSQRGFPLAKGRKTRLSMHNSQRAVYAASQGFFQGNEVSPPANRGRIIGRTGKTITGFSQSVCTKMVMSSSVVQQSSA